MLTTQQPEIKPRGVPSPLTCRPLPTGNAGDLAQVLAMFQDVPRQLLGQAWLEKAETDFAPGNVRVGWRGDSLLVFAELADRDIFNFATADNQRAWELGDTFEIFLQAAGESTYYEFQVTPNNQRVQMYFPDGIALENLRKNSASDAVILPGEVFRSKTWVQHHANCWYVYAEIDAAALGDVGGPLPGRLWRFSFSRYDYTNGRAKPVISSTSRHAIADFHRHQEWDTMGFESLTTQTI